MKSILTFASGPGAFRLFLASLVVLHHSFPLRMGAWAVYMFFILSGYWIALMWEKRYRRSRLPLLTFYVSRWWRLAPVFLLCSALALFATRWPELGLGAPNDPWIWFLQQIPIAGSSMAGRLIPPSWSLDVEMQFYLTAPFIIWLATRTTALWHWLAIATSLSFPFYYFIIGGAPEIGALWPFLSLFLLGIMLARLNWNPGAGLAFGSIGVFVALTSILFLMPGGLDGIWMRGADPHPENDARFVVTMLWWLVGAVICLPFIAWNVHQKGVSWDHWMGNLAFPLYMFHWIPRQIYYALVDWSAPVWWNALLLLANIGTAFLGAILILQFFDLPIDRLRAKWVHSRVPH